jgi:hypothetical protein
MGRGRDPSARPAVVVDRKARLVVATEIDDPWSYVGGPTALVEAILVDDALETVEVGFDDDW